MTGKINEQEMLEIASKMQKNITDKLEILDAQQKTAAKAYKISLAMIEQATKMVSMKFQMKLILSIIMDIPNFQEKKKLKN